MIKTFEEYSIQTDLDSTLLAKGLERIMCEISDNYDLRYDQQEKTGEYSKRIEIEIQKNKKLKDIVQNFIDASIPLLNEFGSDISKDNLYNEEY